MTQTETAMVISILILACSALLTIVFMKTKAIIGLIFVVTIEIIGLVFAGWLPTYTGAMLALILAIIGGKIIQGELNK